MDIKTATDIGLVVVGCVLSGLLGMLWKDLRDVRNKMGNYVKTADCIEKRGVCGTMREAMSNLIEAHGDSLQTMQELLRGQTECLARLDERTRNLKERLEQWAVMLREELQKNGEDYPVRRDRRSTDIKRFPDGAPL